MTAIFQILKTVQGQDQDRFGRSLWPRPRPQKNWSSGLKDYITDLNSYLNS